MKINWKALTCRFGCKSPVAGLYHAPDGCICWPDKVQALCIQHAQKGLQNTNMETILERLEE